MSIIKPSYSSIVNLNHPHTDGLVTCYNMNDLGSVCSDMLRNKHDIALTNTSWETDGLQVNASGEYGLLDNSAQVISYTAGTIILKFKSISSFSDGITRNLFGRNSSTSGDLALFKLSNNVLYFWIYDGTARYVNINSAKVPAWTSGTQISIQWDNVTDIYDGKKLALNIDGIYVVPNGSSNATTIGSVLVSSSLAVLNNSFDVSNFANGVVDYIYIYNKALSEEMLKDIYENPYSMMKSKAGMISVFIPTLIGGNPWYYNAQQM